MALTTLLQAVNSYWSTVQKLVDLFPGGLFTNEIPETYGTNNAPPALPYAYVEVSSTDTHPTMGQTIYYEVSSLEFCLFAPGAAVAENCIQNIKAAYDWVNNALPFADNLTVCTYFMPIRHELVSEPMRYKDGSLIYRGHLRYEVFISRNTPPP